MNALSAATAARSPGLACRLPPGRAPRQRAHAHVSRADTAGTPRTAAPAVAGGYRGRSYGTGLAIALSLALHAWVFGAMPASSQPPAGPPAGPVAQGLAFSAGAFAPAVQPQPSEPKTAAPAADESQNNEPRPAGSMQASVAERPSPVATAPPPVQILAKVPPPSPPVVDRTAAPDRRVTKTRPQPPKAAPAPSMRTQTAARTVPRPQAGTRSEAVNAVPAPGPAQRQASAPVGTGNVANASGSSQAQAAVAPALPSLITDPVYRSPPRPPVYPRRAVRFGQQGTVLVRARLSTEGDVIGVTLRQSSGHSLLDAAALDAVRGWSFQPATRDGHRVLAIVDLPVHFSLQP